MSYLSEVVVVIRGGVMPPPLQLFAVAEHHEIRSDCEYWYWRDIDWGFQTNEVDLWLATLDDTDFLLLRDGEEEYDFGINGRFFESEFYIGICIPTRTTRIIDRHVLSVPVSAPTMSWWDHIKCWLHIPGTSV